MRKKVMVIDSFSLIYKAFYGVRPMKTANGIPTNAIYGFVNMILKLIQEHQPEYLFAAFDMGKANIRLDQYEDYKAGRETMPEDLVPQIPIIMDIFAKADVTVLQSKDYEADDIIGHITNMADEHNFETIVVSGDRDLFQLADANTLIIYAKRGVSDTIHVDPNYIKDTYGVEPLQLIDVKALMGDKSDNIPGVMGVGEKTALKLIKEYNNLDEVYANIENIKGKLHERLVNEKDMAYLSRDLVTIHREIPIEIDLENETTYNFSSNDVIELLQTLEMKNIIKILGGTIEKHEIHTADFRVIDESELEDLTDKKISVLFNANAYHQPFDIGIHYEHQTIVIKDASYVFFKTLCENTRIEKITHGFKSIYKHLLTEGIIPVCFSFDTLLAAYVLDPSDDRYSLDILAQRYLDHKTEQLTKLPVQQSFFDSNTDNKEELLQLLATNAKLNYQLCELFTEKLKETSMLDLYNNIEHKLMFVLAEMEMEGFKVDIEMLKRLEEDFDKRAEKLTREILKLADKSEAFNINSPKQLGVLLFEELGLPVIKKTKTGYSTDAEVLGRLEDMHPIIPKIIELRKILKINSTYIKGIMKITDPNTDKIHTTFNQTVTSTGRISSSAPNLQNIPIKTDEGRDIRKIFIPSSENNLLIDADYSQIELRILAHISNDKNMIQAFLNKEDIHTRTASEVFDVPINEVTSLQRSQAKAVNFGIVYGISDYGLSRNLNISRKAAKSYIEKYLNSFPGVKQYMHDIVEQAREDGYSVTMFGRRRYIPEIYSKNYTIRSFAERTALNTPIQGSAADIIKIAMIHVDEELRKHNYKANLILQIHDELIIDCPEDELEPVTQLLKEKMEEAAKLSVPLIADIASAKNWYDAK